MPDLDQLARNFAPFCRAAEPAELVVLLQVIADELHERKLPGLADAILAAHKLQLYASAQDAARRGKPILGQDCTRTSE